MIKQKIFLTLDTETVGLPPKNFVYDVGYTIHNKAGEIFAARSFLVRDVITDPKKMMSAFYAKKIFSFYIPALDEGTMKLWDANFDIRDMNSTNALLKGAPIIPRPVDRLCIWNFACNVLLNRPTYHAMADANGWRSRAGNVRTTAEHTYRYITGLTDFIESHTALHDAEIETDILTRCFAQKKTIPYNELPAMPWQIAQKVA